MTEIYKNEEFIKWIENEDFSDIELFDYYMTVHNIENDTKQVDITKLNHDTYEFRYLNSFIYICHGDYLISKNISLESYIKEYIRKRNISKL